MTPAALLSLASLTLFSLADLRYRVAPGATVFFLAAVILAAPEDPLRVSLVVLAVGWGLLRWPSFLIALAIFFPFSWTVALTSGGVRRGLVGAADLLVLGGLACLFDWPATVCALVGVEIWRRFWKKQASCPVPALMGMLLGFTVYLILSNHP